MTLEEMDAAEREATAIRETMWQRLRILDRHIKRIQRRRYNLLHHPNWETVTSKAACKR